MTSVSKATPPGHPLTPPFTPKDYGIFFLAGVYQLTDLEPFPSNILSQEQYVRRKHKISLKGQIMMGL